MNRLEIDFLAEFIFESDAIEGIDNNYDELVCEIETGKQDGHVGAMLILKSMAKDKMSKLDDGGICNIQKLITEHQHLKSGERKLKKKHIGKYRDVNVSVITKNNLWLMQYFIEEEGLKLSPHDFIEKDKKIPHEEVSFAMRSLIEEMSSWQEGCLGCSQKEIIAKIADFHFTFEGIHPFVDGNGRTGRAIVYYLFKYAGIPPFIFTNGDKRETYYTCFKKKEAMRKYFFEKAKV